MNKIKISIVIIIVSVILTIALDIISAYKNQLVDYLLNNIKSYTIIDYTKKKRYYLCIIKNT